MAHVLHDGIGFDQITVAHPGGYEVILYNHAGVIHGYRNSCPHVGVGLDWGTGRCLSAPNELQCALHGAVFIADTGECVAGPCYGQSLTRVAVSVVDGKVVCE